MKTAAVISFVIVIPSDILFLTSFTINPDGNWSVFWVEGSSADSGPAQGFGVQKVRYNTCNIFSLNVIDTVYLRLNKSLFITFLITLFTLTRDHLYFPRG